MAVHIRLKKFGTKNKSCWRVVVSDVKMPRDGRFIEQVGYYNPHTNPVKLQLNSDRIAHWVSKGAKASDTVKSLLKKQKKQSGK